MNYNVYNEILKVVYTNYTSNLIDLFNIYNEKYPLAYTKFKTHIKTLESAGFLKTAEIKLGIRGGKKIVVLATEKGELLAMKMVPEIVAIKEAEELINKHTTLEHGYMIKRAKDLFIENNIPVYDDYKSCRFVTNLRTDRGRPIKIEVDLLLDIDGHILPIECETGKCPENNLIEKLTKVNNRFNVLAIIAPNEKAVAKTEKTINKWRAKKEENENLTIIMINLTSVIIQKNIKEKIFEYIEMIKEQ